MQTSGLGLVPVQQVIQAHFPRAGSAQARFRMMAPFNPLQRALVTPIPGLPGRGYSDLRWFAVQSLAARRIVREEMRAWQPTFAHVTVSGAALLLPSLQTEIPCVPSFDVTMGEWMRLMYHLPSEEKLAHPWRLLQERERHVLDTAPLAIAWTDHVSTRMRSLAPLARIETLHPGLNLDLFTPRSTPRRPGVPRILFVGGRFAGKGGPVLLAAAEQLARPVEVHVVTTEQVQPHPLMTLHRAGPGTEYLAELFRDADLFCLPTTRDAVPWVILEAQASGLPVVSTAVGSIPEMLPARCGRVVPPGNVSALRDALAELVDDEAQLAAMGEAARANVETSYDAHRNTARLIDLLSTVGLP